MTNNAQSEQADLIRYCINNGYVIPAHAIWIDLVGYGRPWDHKKKIQDMERFADRDPESQTVGIYQYSFDTWSNIHYGYVGASVNFSEGELLGGAGAAQLINAYKNSLEKQGIKGTLRNPPLIPVQDGYFGATRFDYPEDTAAIKLGIELWNTYQLNLQITDLLNALPNYPGLNRKPLE